MPKIKKTIPRSYSTYVAQESVAARATMIFDTAAQLTYFGNGGTSFVLENTQGYKVRFLYTTFLGADNAYAGGFFTNDNDLQPRFLEDNNFNSAYYSYSDHDYDFFGYGWDLSLDTHINGFEQGSEVRIYYGDISQQLVSSDQTVVESAVITLVERTIRAINYAKEIKMTASVLSGDTSLQIVQQVKGPSGNTNIFRGYSFGFNAEGSYYDILTSDITTIDFNGGEDELAGDVVNWTKKSGNLGNAVKKRINKKSFEIGTLPVNQLFTGQKLKTIENYFDDSSTFNFLNSNDQRIDVRLGVPYAQIQSRNGNVADFVFDNPIISNDYYTWYENENTNEIVEQAYFVARYHKNRKISNSNIFSTPNSFQNLNINNDADFVYYSEDYNIFKKASKLNQKNIDLYLDKVNAYDSISPYTESNKIIEFDDSQWQTSNTSKVSYNISESKQISLELGFNKNNQGSPAILLDTAKTNIDDEKILVHDTAITRFSQHTSYYNFSENEWNYLHHQLSYPGNDDLFGINGINRLPYSKDFLQTIGSKQDFEEKISRYVRYSNKITSPSFRIDLPNNNSSSMMKISDNSGFPYQEKWSPQSDQTLKMSDYITSDFMLEKIKIKCNVKARAKLNLDAIDPSNVLFESDAYFGMSFFFLRNYIVEENTTNKKSNITYHMQTDITGENTPEWLHQDTFDTVFSENSDSLTRIDDDFSIIQGNFQSDEIRYVIEQDNHDLIPYSDTEIYNFARLTDPEDSVVPNGYQIKMSNNVNDFNNDIFTNVFNISGNSRISNRVSKTNRDLITFNNVIFHASNASSEVIENLQKDKNIDALSGILNSDASDIIFEFDLKRTSNEKHTDESVFYNSESGNSENLFIFEGKNLQNKSPRIFDLKYTSQEINDFYNNVNYKLFSSDYQDNIQNYNYLLKPSDELVFGISSYGNGNLISTLVELYDNIEIVLIGKEINENYYKDESKSIRKVISSNIDSSKSNQENVNSLSKNKSFFSTDNRTNKSLLTNSNSYIYDSVLPDFYQLFDLKSKTLYYNQTGTGFGTAFINNITLFEKNSNNYENTDVVSSNIFSNDIYEQFLFKEYENDQKFKQFRTSNFNLSRSVLNIENTSIDNAASLSQESTIISKISFDEKGIDEYSSSYIDLLTKLYPVLNTIFKNSESSFKKYTSPYQNIDAFSMGSYSDVFCSTLKPKNADIYNFLFSDKNYNVNKNVNNDDMYRVPVSIRIFDNRAYLVLEEFSWSEKLTNFWNNIKSLFANDMIDTDDLSYSKFTIPITLRSFFHNQDEVIGISDIDGLSFTKDFMYVHENISGSYLGRRKLVCFLDYYEMSNKYYNFTSASINSNTTRTNVEEFEYIADVGAGSFIWTLVDRILNETQSWLVLKNYSNSNVDYLKDSDMNFDSLKFAYGATGGDLFDEENAKESVGAFMFDNFSVDIHHTNYKTELNSGLNVYKDLISSDLTFKNVDNKIKNNYHYYMDKNLIENNVEDYHKVFEDRRIPSDKTSAFINNEMIYLSKLYYAKNTSDSISDLQKTKYSVIFKYINHTKNGIDYPYMQIYSIINDLSFNTSIKLSYEDISLDFEDLSTGYIRIYEPYLLEGFNNNAVEENNVPYFELNLSDFTFQQIFANNVSQSSVYSSSKLKYITDSSTENNYDYLIRNFNYFDESRGGKRSYLPWGTLQNKEEVINSLVYLYGDKYLNYPIEKKAGFVYGVENSFPICSQQFFSTYRYGHFSDHIKYSKNYARYSISNNNTEVITYPAEKTFYNSYFEKTTQDNSNQTFNKNLYCQSSYPYVESASNILSQLNIENSLYDENNVF